MNARVSVLLLVTGIFMAVWTADQRAMDTAGMKRLQARMDVAGTSTGGSPSLISAALQAELEHRSRSLSSAMPQYASVSEILFQEILPVPCDLADGSWEVLNESGATFRITIELTSPGQSSPDRFSICSAPDGGRWCFVRKPVRPTVPSPGSPVEFWSPTPDRLAPTQLPVDESAVSARPSPEIHLPTRPALPIPEL